MLIQLLPLRLTCVLLETTSTMTHIVEHENTTLNETESKLGECMCLKKNEERKCQETPAETRSIC